MSSQCPLHTDASASQTAVMVKITGFVISVSLLTEPYHADGPANNRAPSDVLLPRPHPVERIERCDLVPLRQRRIVERVLDEIVDRALEVEHCLADVDQLGSALAQDVDAEQPAR